MNYCLVSGTKILKRYLDPMQCQADKRSQLVKIYTWVGEARKSDLDFVAGKKKVKDDKGNDVDVDGEVKVKT